MREILFRGKRCDNGKWIYGYFVYDESGQKTEKDTAYIYQLNKHPCGWDLIPFEVIPETVGQYTGLTDKNGKKIFEGDVVRCYFADGYKEEGSIRWLNADSRFSFVPFDEQYHWGIDDTDKFEIIGNIHDNPELLKGGEG